MMVHAPDSTMALHKLVKGQGFVFLLLQVELHPQDQALSGGAICDAFPTRRALAHLQNPLQAALTMDHAKPVVEPSNDFG